MKIQKIVLGVLVAASVAVTGALSVISKADDPGDPGDILGGGGSGIGAQNENLPVDGGVSYLLVAGAVYGYRRLKNKPEAEAEQA